MEYVVDGKKLTEEEFKEIQSNPNLKLKKLTENTYTTLQKMYG